MIKGLRRFWTRSIRRQLVLGIALVHAVLMTIFVVDLVSRQQGFLREQSEDQALSLADTLATNGAPWVLANDVVGMEELLHSLDDYPGLDYAFLVSPEGRVLSHTRPELTGEYVRDRRSRALLEAEPRRKTVSRSPQLIDVAAPITVDGRLIGWARIGLSQRSNTNNIVQAARDGLFYTLAAILVGTLFALVMARGLTRSLYRMLGVVRRVRDGRLDHRIELDRPDELGELSDQIDGMLDALEASDHSLRQAREQLHLALEGSGTGWWDWDVGSDRVTFSPTWKRMLGFSGHDVGIPAEEWRARVHPDDLEQTRADVDAHMRGHTGRYENIHRMRHREGHWFWVLDRGLALHDDRGTVRRMVGTHTDISNRVRTEQALQKAKQRLAVTLQSIGDGVITTDAEGRVENMNPKAEALTGWRLGEAHLRPVDDVLHLCRDNGERADPVGEMLSSPRARGQSEHGEIRARDGSTVPVEFITSPIRDGGPESTGTVVVLHDVSEARRMAEEMSWLASHDPLTGLYNRRAFEEELERMLETARRDGRMHAMLYLDLDQFKVVNDTSGHLAGDELLRQLTRLLPDRLRQSDILARLGGDEFGLLLESCDEEHARAIAEDLRRTIADFNFLWRGQIFNVGVSIGVVVIDAAWPSPEAILSAADVACYTAKEHGRNRYHVYRSEDEEVGGHHQQMQLVSEIREALREDRMQLLGQTIIPLAREDDAGHPHVEVLVRMQDREGRTISPGFFIPAAERYDLMQRVDRWVIRHALKTLSEIDADVEHGPGRCFINLSGNSLADPDILGFIREQLETFRVPARRLCFEVTETAAISNLETAIELMGSLRRMGCWFALDDFGSGLSSFAYLKNLPVDCLKIDGEFTRKIDVEATDRVFVQAINEVGHTLGLTTIAEFVESAEILETARALGVDYAQGYHITRPRPLAEALRDDQGGAQ